MVNLSGCRDRRIGDLSGGELQRLLLALALGREPELLLLDEPISSVDAGSREDLIHLLARLRREFGFTQLMVSHDLLPSLAAADHLICLDRRTVAEGSPAGLAAGGALRSFFPGLAPDFFAEAGAGEGAHA
jgi:zinc transport system ATP-binding protein